MVLVPDPEKQIQGAKEFTDAIEGLLRLFQRDEKEADNSTGLWKTNGDLSLADVMAAPCKFKGRLDQFVKLIERSY